MSRTQLVRPPIHRRKRHISLSPSEYVPQIQHLREASQLFFVWCSTTCSSNLLTRSLESSSACVAILGGVLVQGKIVSRHCPLFLQVRMANVMAEMIFPLLILVSLVPFLHHYRSSFMFLYSRVFFVCVSLFYLSTQIRKGCV